MSRPVLTPTDKHPITIAPTDGRVVVRVGGTVVADSNHALTLREASYPPVQYIPLADVDPAVLRPSQTATYCPYKGEASYYSVQPPAAPRWPTRSGPTRTRTRRSPRSPAMSRSTPTGPR